MRLPTRAFALTTMRRRVATIAVIAVAGLLMACTPDANDTGPNSRGAGDGATAGTAGTAQNGGGSVGDGPSGSTGADPTTGAGTPTAGTAKTPAAPKDTRAVIGNIELSAQNVQCAYVPRGNLDGSDGLTVFVYTLLIGTNALPEPIRTTMSIDNGYSTVYTGHPSNQAVHGFQGPIRPNDWGGTLTVRIQADSDDRYRESNEADNTIQVTVRLPATRPSQTVDPLPCSTRRV